MGEIQLTRIKSVYGDIKGLLSQIPLAETIPTIDSFTVNTFNEAIDELSRITSTDYSRYNVPQNQEMSDWPGKFDSKVVRAQIGRVISRLEQEYGFGEKNQSSITPGIVIFNKNQNEISLQINYTINDLINKQGDEEGKKKLGELKTELEKSDKSWESIRKILVWILNFSKELFVEIIPIILQKKL